MGGAFIGASDDASTAYANPAGLTKISTREISIECRYRGVEMAFLQGGRLSGAPTGTGVDTSNSPIYGTDEDRKLGAWIHLLRAAARQCHDGLLSSRVGEHGVVVRLLRRVPSLRHRGRCP